MTLWGTICLLGFLLNQKLCPDFQRMPSECLLWIHVITAPQASPMSFTSRSLFTANSFLMKVLLFPPCYESGKWYQRSQSSFPWALNYQFQTWDAGCFPPLLMPGCVVARLRVKFPACWSYEQVVRNGQEPGTGWGSGEQACSTSVMWMASGSYRELKAHSLMALILVLSLSVPPRLYGALLKYSLSAGRKAASSMKVHLRTKASSK